MRIRGLALAAALGVLLAVAPITRAEDTATQALGARPDAEAEDLPDGADLGPPLGAAPRADEALVDAPIRAVALQVAAGAGFPPGTSLDETLAAHRFGPSIAALVGDATVLARVLSWLHVGGRVGFRSRGWTSVGAPLALAGGLDALAIVEARVQAGRVLDVALSVGGGVGVATFGLRGQAAWGLAPRVHASGIVGFRVDPAARLFVRAGWDWFVGEGLVGLGDPLDLGGPLAALGLEVRG